MLLSPRKNGLTSLFKEVRVFKVARGLPTGGQGSKVYVLCAEPKEYKHFVRVPGREDLGYPAGRIGDRGDREIVYVPDVYVPFPAPRLQARYSPETHKIGENWQVRCPTMEPVFVKRVLRFRGFFPWNLGVPRDISANLTQFWPWLVLTYFAGQTWPIFTYSDLFAGRTWPIFIYFDLFRFTLRLHRRGT